MTFSKASQLHKAPTKKPKKVTVKPVKDRCWELVKQIVRLRDEYTCQWCGKVLEPASCQTSHVIPRSKGNALYFDLQNLKVLCYYCHKSRWHAHPKLAWEWFSSQFPQRAAYLALHENDQVHWKMSDFLQLENDLTLIKEAYERNV